MGRWTRRILIAAGTVAGIAALAAGGVYAASEMQLRRTYEVAERPLAVRPDPATLEQGRHLATAIGKCSDCHGEGLGGKTFIDDAALGVIQAPNLTPGLGGVKDWSDAELERAIRHGVAPTGRALLAMPSAEFYHLSDRDLESLVAYLRSLPPVDRELPASALGPLGRALLVSGKLPILAAAQIDHAAPRPAAPAPGVTREYGEYLATVGGCRGCHGPELVGGPIAGTPPDWPPAANLTPAAIGRWTEADFVRAMRGGKRPDGTDIRAPYMPWPLAGQMTDDELRAVWIYLQDVPAKETPKA